MQHFISLFQEKAEIRGLEKPGKSVRVKKPLALLELGLRISYTYIIMTQYVIIISNLEFCV